MAKLLNKYVGEFAGKAVSKYNDLTQDTAGVLTGPLNKLWRARILLNRATSTLPKDTALKGKVYDPNGVWGEAQISSKNPRLNKELQEKWRLELQYPRVSETGGPDPAVGNKSITNQRNFEVNSESRFMNEIRIWNLSVDPQQYITLQNRPPELDFRGETTWATIKSMGRNTPMYHYTGAEDIIQFNVSWYSTSLENPREVINKCRVLEAWSKANGYQAAPPILKIEWGSSGIFDDHYYILTSATYTLKNFQNGYRVRKPGQKAVIGNGKLLPAAATQELIFKRVSAYNLSYGDFIDSDSLQKTVNTK